MIRYAIEGSALGRMLVARTEKGICAVAFGDEDLALECELRGRFPGARLELSPEAVVAEVEAVLAQLGDNPPETLPALDLPGTEFQRRAWAAMQAIPRGETLTYQQLAAKLGKPNAQMAAGQTCSRNPIAVLVPCHRMVAQGGKMQHYHWGVERKVKLLEIERRQAGKAPSGSRPEQGQLGLEL